LPQSLSAGSSPDQGRASPLPFGARRPHRTELRWLFGRDRLTHGLQALGFDVIPSQGTYFLNIDIAPLGESDDLEFCKRLVTEHGVAAIPVSAFYAENPVRNVVRLCFSKNDQTLDAGLERLARAIGKMK